MNKANWARRVELADRKLPAPSAPPSSSTAAATASGATPTGSALVPGSGGGALAASRRFVIPVPGRDGPRNSLAGKTIVLSGIFPEVRARRLTLSYLSTFPHTTPGP
jgi:hypothetical protein